MLSDFCMEMKVDPYNKILTGGETLYQTTG